MIDGPSEAPSKVDLVLQMAKFEENFSKLQPNALTPEAIMGAINKTLADISNELGANYTLNPNAYRPRFFDALKRLFVQIAEEGRTPEVSIEGSTIKIEFTSQEGEKTIVDKWWKLSVTHNSSNYGSSFMLRTIGVNLGEDKNVPAGPIYALRSKSMHRYKADPSVEIQDDLVSDVVADMNGQLVDGSTWTEEE